MGKVLAGITISVDGFITGPGDLPHEGWGRLVFSEASTAAGRDFTNDGMVHEDRGLKGRSRQARSRMAVRNVPIPPEIVHLLREHMDRFGTADDGRLFRTKTALRSSRPRTGRSG